MEPLYRYFESPVLGDGESLISKADAAAGELADAGEPKDAEQRVAMEGYEANFIVRMTHGSAAIEGSTLTLVETALVLAREFVPKSMRQRNDMMASIGIADAYRYALRQARDGRDLSRALMQDIHERVAIDMDSSIRGTPRTVPVRITGSSTTPPEPTKVREAMDDLGYLCGTTTLHPLVAAAATHKAFESIHPFVDGNGRTGRVLMNFHLLRCGYPPIAIGASSRADYISALGQWDIDRDLGPLVAIICKRVIAESQDRMAILRPSSS